MVTGQLIAQAVASNLATVTDTATAAINTSATAANNYTTALKAYSHSDHDPGGHARTQRCA